MLDNLKMAFGKAKDWWKSLAKNTRMIIGGGILSVLAVIAIIAVINVARPYEVLFTDVNQEELSEIVTYLAENGYGDYRITNNDTIMVPASQKERIAAELIVQGYPRSGYAHSTYFDHVGSLTTESERSTLALYDLADELEAVIRCLDGVSNASVNITPEKDSSYVLDKNNSSSAKATVMVTMKSGGMLSKKQVNGIRNYVSHSVEGLEISNVAVLDSYGNTYSSDGLFGNAEDVSALKLMLEEQVNNDVRNRVFQVHHV